MNNNQVVNPNEFLQASTTFDEVLPEPITVTWVEFVEGEKQLPDGRTIKVRKPFQRKSEINTYVPVRILNKMMASQEKIKRIQAARSKGPENIDMQTQQEMVSWMEEQVLNVWQLSEPDMTIEQLHDGLDFKKIFGLFSFFFGNLLGTFNKQ